MSETYIVVLIEKNIRRIKKIRRNKKKEKLYEITILILFNMYYDVISFSIYYNEYIFF